MLQNFTVKKCGRQKAAR